MTPTAIYTVARALGDWKPVMPWVTKLTDNQKLFQVKTDLGPVEAFQFQGKTRVWYPRTSVMTNGPISIS